MKVISHLPIQKKFYKTIKPKEIQRMVTITAEIFYILRPLIHCLALRYYGQNSWTPYLISLVVDLLRMLLEINFKFTSRSQREEFVHRNHTGLLNYLMRNPFYSGVLKGRILGPFFDKIFGAKSMIKWLFFLIIEMRCCLSTLMWNILIYTVN
jgi:peroxin-16